MRTATSGAGPRCRWRTKSLAMVAMMAAAGRANELRVHLKGALANGCTAEQIQEILLLVAMYCGIPAANEAHRVAVEVLRESGAARSQARLIAAWRRSVCSLPWRGDRKQRYCCGMPAASRTAFQRLNSALQVLAERLGGGALHDHAGLGQPLAHRLILEDLVERRVELGDDCGRRAARREEAVPGGDVEAGQHARFDRRRHVAAPPGSGPCR